MVDLIECNVIMVINLNKIARGVYEAQTFSSSLGFHLIHAVKAWNFLNEMAKPGIF